MNTEKFPDVANLKALEVRKPSRRADGSHFRVMVSIPVTYLTGFMSVSAGLMTEWVYVARMGNDAEMFYAIQAFVFGASTSGFLFGTLIHLILVSKWIAWAQVEERREWHDRPPKAIPTIPIPSHDTDVPRYRTPKTLLKGQRGEFTFSGAVLDKVTEWVNGGDWNGHLTGRKGTFPYSLQEAGLSNNSEQGRALAALDEMDLRGADRKLTRAGVDWFLMESE